MISFLMQAGFFVIVVLAVIISIILIWKMTEKIAFAPGLDLAISLLTWIPWVAALTFIGWLGVLACVIGQLVAMQIFCFIHWRWSGHRGPSIGTTLNRIVGPVSNNVALLATVPALPAFLLIRFSQWTTYPMLVWLIKLPPYKQAEWVNVSRQKFSGLVGHDLVWCLYCDWMTGIYSLGGEMLRNLESFWCPIRFYPGKKCENCKLDFPDVEKWVDAKGSMKEVEDILKEKYEGKGWNSWWSHPERNKKD